MRPVGPSETRWDRSPPAALPLGKFRKFEQAETIPVRDPSFAGL